MLNERVPLLTRPLIISLFSSGAYSNLTVLGGKQYHVHQNIVCHSSNVFDTICKSTWQLANKIPKSDLASTEDTVDGGSDDASYSSSTDEPDGHPDDLVATRPFAKYTVASTSDAKIVIDLRGENEVAVDCVMQFLYLGNYNAHAFTAATSADPTSSSTLPALHVHVLVHKLAEVYDLALLKALALSKFQFDLALSFDIDDFTSATIEAFAHMHETFADLRSALSKGFHQHRQRLLADDKIALLLCEHGSITFRFLKYLNENPWG